MTTTVNNYVISYDAGSKPYSHDSSRGKWSSPKDFYLACVSHAFGIINFSFLPAYILLHGGVLVIIPYIISLFLFVLPIFVFQSFLGQFSSSGFISVFRISPLFKGIGYVILLVNVVTACVYSVLSAFPLLYFFASFSFELPWMSCNHTWNAENCTENYTNSATWFDLSHAAVEYFETTIVNFDEDVKMSWPLFGGIIPVWILVTLGVRQGLHSVTKMVRISSVIIFITLITIFIRFLCFPDTLVHTFEHFIPSQEVLRHIIFWIPVPYISTYFLGTGWGTVLTLASYNRFRADAMKYSWFICLTTLGAALLASTCVALADTYLREHLNFYDYYHYEEYSLSFLFIGFPYLFGNMEASQMWSLMFFLMLFLCEINALVIVVFSILTAIFDEYESLRQYKNEISIGLPAALFLLSIMFCTNRFCELFTFVSSMAGISQMALCLVQLIVVVWIYGRVRFQRDIQFMLAKTFPTWKFYLIRFVTPLFILFSTFIRVIITVESLHYYLLSIFLVIMTFKLAPWLIIPGYAVIKLISATGSLLSRFRQCTRPNDWYPVDPVDRQRYEETLGTSDVTHQLVFMNSLEEE